MARRRARELAFRTLFQAERGSEDLLSVWESVRTELGESGEDDVDDAYGEAYGDPLDSGGIAFADSLLRSYLEHKVHLDEVLEESVTGWSFNQMAQTDLNVLRLAVTEMYHSNNPPEVAIEMAVRLAKKFGGDESGRFVNGVLAKVYRVYKSRPGSDPDPERGLEPIPDPERGLDPIPDPERGLDPIPDPNPDPRAGSDTSEEGDVTRGG